MHFSIIVKPKLSEKFFVLVGTSSSFPSTRTSLYVWQAVSCLLFVAILEARRALV